MTAIMPAVTMRGTTSADASPFVRALQGAFERATGDETTLSPHVETLEGMSGLRYRRFVNFLVAALPQPAYLEIGSWTGSTLCAAIHGHRLRALAIDNWSMFGGPLQTFLRNVADTECADVDLNLLTADFRSVNFATIGRFNVYLFDGPHAYEDQYDGLVLAQPALESEFVFMVDDWNWPAVRAGTMDAIRDLGLEVRQAIEIRTTADDTHPALARQHSDWHNGYFLSVLKKPGR